MSKGIFKYHKDLWVEKYRPTTLDEYITSTDLKEKFKSYIDNQNIGNLLFEGPPGTGKCLDASTLIDIEIELTEKEFEQLKKYKNDI